jgi:hypothetical protein
MSILIFRGFFPAFTLNVLICFIPSEEIPKIALGGLSKEKRATTIYFFFFPSFTISKDSWYLNFNNTNYQTGTTINTGW